jgi:hypothetical protein
VLVLLGFSLTLERQMSDKEEQAKRRLYEISKGFLIWGAAAGDWHRSSSFAQCVG